MRRHVDGEMGKTESFWTRNVKLIAFLLTVVILLGIPVAYFAIRDYKPEDTRPQMTLEQLKELAGRPGQVTQEELDRYRGENEERKIDGVTVEVYYYITVGDRYHLDAVKVLVPETGTVQNDKTQITGAELSYLSVYDRVTRERLDLLSKNADVDAFCGD